MKAAVSLQLAILLCALYAARVSAQCGAGLLYCTGINQCYSQGAYNCIPQPSGGGNFLCPPNTCLCGQNTCYTSQYGCKDGALTQNPWTDKDGNCPGGSGGDPIVRNFDGCRWFMEGEAGKTYNLVAGPDDTVNTLLVAANLTDEHHKGNGTFHGTLAFRHKDHVLEANVDAEGNLTVTLDGTTQPFDTRFQLDGMKGKVVRHMPFFGQYLEASTESFTYAVHAVQPVTTEAGLQRGHADLDVTLRKAVPGLHGLLGQSQATMHAPQCREDYAFPGAGTEADYQVSGISSIPQDLTPVARVSRKLIEEDVDALLPATATTAV